MLEQQTSNLCQTVRYLFKTEKNEKLVLIGMYM